MFSVMQSPCTLREAETKKGRCSVSGNGPLTFVLLLELSRMPPLLLEHALRGLAFRKCGEIGNRRAQPDFCHQNRRSRKGKTWVRLADLGFPALPKAPAGSMRQNLKPPSTPPFSSKEAAGRNVAAIRRGRYVW